MIGWYGCEKEAEAGCVLRVAGIGLRVTCCELCVAGFELPIAGAVALVDDYFDV